MDALFRALGQPADVRPRRLTFRYASWQDARTALEAHGIAVLARQGMPPDKYEEMFQEIQRLMESHDYGEGDAILVDSDYLEVLVTKS